MEQLLEQFEINPVYAEILVKDAVLSLNVDPEILKGLIKLNDPFVFDIKLLDYGFMKVYMAERECEDDEFLQKFVSDMKKEEIYVKYISLSDDEEEDILEDVEELNLEEDDDSFIDDTEVKDEIEESSSEEDEMEEEEEDEYEIEDETSSEADETDDETSSEEEIY